MITPFEIVNPERSSRLVLTCEHASCVMPAEYDNLGMDDQQLRDHIGWDVGAGVVAKALAEYLDASAVLSGVSRLLIDCNRELCEPDLVPAESHGVMIPGNALVDGADRDRRVRDFYRPYHGAIDALLVNRPGSFLLSVHSFTPTLEGRRRHFDAGVLFDEYPDEAEKFGAALAATGLRVRYNQPYSGLEGLIFSAHEHGQRHGVRYLEIELNNGLLREEQAARAVARQVAMALRSVLEA